MKPGYQRYAELHCHSSFSFLDGASNPEDLAIRAKEVGLSALAITDHDDFGGIVRFAYAARELQLPAIIGCELTLEDDSHLILLVENERGYKNLSYLITQARMGAQKKIMVADGDFNRKAEEAFIKAEKQYLTQLNALTEAQRNAVVFAVKNRQMPDDKSFFAKRTRDRDARRNSSRHFNDG